MKKGASDLISTVLLISVAIIIAVMIMNFSKGFLKKQNVQTDMISSNPDAELYILSDLASLSLFGNGDEEELTLGVRRLDNQGDVKGVRFIFEDDKGNIYSYDDYENPPNEAGIVKQYSLTLEDIKVTDFSDIKKISVSFLYGENEATGILDEKEIVL